MKKLEILLVILLMLSSFKMKAQAPNSPVKNLYEQIDDSKVNIVYITRKMVELRIQQETSLENKEAIESLLSNFHELIMVGTVADFKLPEETIKNLRKTLKERNYEQIVQMNDNGESITGYLLEDDSKRILDLVIILLEKDEQMIISASGTLTMQDLGVISKLFNINILGFINF